MLTAQSARFIAFRRFIAFPLINAIIACAANLAL